MADLIFTGATYSGEDAKEIILAPAYESAEIALFHNIMSGINFKKRYAIGNALEKLTKKKTTCEGTATAATLIDREVEFSPVSMQVYLTYCFEDFINQIGAYTRKAGNEANENDMYNAFLAEVARQAVTQDVPRIAWFGDTAAANVDDTVPGVFTSGVDVADYTLLNGFFKQYFTLVGTSDTPRYTITENSNATFATQTTLTANRAIEIFEEMLKLADNRLRGSMDKIFLCTTEVYDNYKKSLQNTANVMGQETLINGLRSLMWDGIQIVDMTNIWSRHIKADQINLAGTAYNLPNRVVLTTKDNNWIGFDANPEGQSFETGSNRETEKVWMRNKWTMDAKVALPYMTVIAY